MTQAHDEDDDRTGDESEDRQDGQVSEMVPEGDAPEPISSGDSVAGQPADESGEVQEGAQGPNAIPQDDTGEHPHTT